MYIWLLSPWGKQKTFLSTVPDILYSHSIYSTQKYGILHLISVFSNIVQPNFLFIIYITPEVDHSERPASCVISFQISLKYLVLKWFPVSKKHHNHILGYYMMLDQNNFNCHKSWMKMKDSQYKMWTKLLCWLEVWRDVTVGMIQILCNWKVQYIS